jgi:energy-coupling factor transport system ATP-binding protein
MDYKNIFINADNISFSYKQTNYDDLVHESEKALDDVSLKIDKGQFVVMLGRNGSGKSTFAKHINGLLEPDIGIVTIAGLDTKDYEHIWDIRRMVGMVFQNPDNQIVGTTVEEDLAFGMENIGIEPSKMRNRVNAAAQTVGMGDYLEKAPSMLSGGQKQRVAIAGILAMQPECIVLDEATAMLDPAGREEVLSIVKILNTHENITIIHITHHMEEACNADRVIVLDGGKVVSDGTPHEVFADTKSVKEAGLALPQVSEVFAQLSEMGVDIQRDILSIDEASQIFSEMIKNKKGGAQ